MKTFYEALDEFWELKKNELKPYTKFGYSERIKRLKDIFADLKLEDITTEEVQDYVDDWQKKYSVATINGYLQIIKQVLKQNGFILKKINVKNDKPKKLRLYSAEDIEKIEQYYSNHKEKIKVHHLPIFIALYTGMRIGEILGLQWLDIDLDRGLIDVSKNAQEIKEDGKRKRIIQTPKTLSSNRTIAIHNNLLKFLNHSDQKMMKIGKLMFAVGIVNHTMGEVSQKVQKNYFQRLMLIGKGFTHLDIPMPQG